MVTYNFKKLGDKKVKIIKPTVANGEKVKPGKIVKLKENIADYLVDNKFALYV